MDSYMFYNEKLSLTTRPRDTGSSIKMTTFKHLLVISDYALSNYMSILNKCFPETIDPEEIKRFKENKLVRENVIRLMKRLISYIGFEVKNYNDIVQIKKIRRTSGNFKMGLYNGKFRSKIGRILNFLITINMEPLAALFMLVLCYAMKLDGGLYNYFHSKGLIKSWIETQPYIRPGLKIGARHFDYNEKAETVHIKPPPLAVKAKQGKPSSITRHKQKTPDKVEKIDIQIPTQQRAVQIRRQPAEQKTSVKPEPIETKLPKKLEPVKGVKYMIKATGQIVDDPSLYHKIPKIGEKYIRKPENEVKLIQSISKPDNKTGLHVIKPIQTKPENEVKPVQVVNKPVNKPAQVQKPITQNNECNFAGLLNTGNSCYLDSVLVSLFAIDIPFIQQNIIEADVKKISNTAKKSMNCDNEYQDRKNIQQELKNIALSMRGKKTNSGYCTDLRKLLKNCKSNSGQRFDETRQQDAGEFLIYLFNIFEVEGTYRQNFKYATNDMGIDFDKLNKVLLNDYKFQANPVVLMEPAYISEGSKISDYLQVTYDAVPDEPYRGPTMNYKRIIDISNKVLSAEFLAFYTPRVYIGDKGEKIKNKRAIIPDTPLMVGNNILDLYSIVTHQGTYNAGHYTCYIKCGSTWYYYDDLSANIIKVGNELKNNKSLPDPFTEGTLYFYKKRAMVRSNLPVQSVQFIQQPTQNAQPSTIENIIKIQNMSNLTKLLQDLNKYKTSNINFHSGDVFEHSIWSALYMDDMFENDNKNISSLDRTEYRKILIVAALLHDIGKGGDNELTFFDKPKHPEAGAKYFDNGYPMTNGQKLDIRVILNELGIKETDFAFIKFLIKHHWLIGKSIANKNTKDAQVELYKNFNKACDKDGVDLKSRPYYFEGLWAIWMVDLYATIPYTGQIHKISKQIGIKSSPGKSHDILSTNMYEFYNVDSKYNILKYVLDRLNIDKAYTNTNIIRPVSSVGPADILLKKETIGNVFKKLLKITANSTENMIIPVTTFIYVNNTYNNVAHNNNVVLEGTTVTTHDIPSFDIYDDNERQKIYLSKDDKKISRIAAFSDRFANLASKYTTCMLTVEMYDHNKRLDNITIITYIQNEEIIFRTVGVALLDYSNDIYGDFENFLDYLAEVEVENKLYNDLMDNNINDYTDKTIGNRYYQLYLFCKNMENPGLLDKKVNEEDVTNFMVETVRQYITKIPIMADMLMVE